MLQNIIMKYDFKNQENGSTPWYQTGRLSEGMILISFWKT